MSHGKTALSLMMAFTLPGIAQALGLGEIRLSSALNEPLTADIDIVGATAADLAGITASIANREAFERFDIDRPAFLSTVVFKVSQDSAGRAVLTIRSSDACTEPLVNMLVDVRWRGGELVRQYTLLLDPAGSPSAPAVVDAVVHAPVTYTAPTSVRQAVAKSLVEIPRSIVNAAAAPKNAGISAGKSSAGKTVKIGAKATLRGVAWRVGARSDADLKRMMIAILRANPNAFEGNINRMRRGAVLTIPSAAEAAAISVADADKEVYAQMQAWHAPAAVAGSAESTPIATAGTASGLRTDIESAAPHETALDRKIEHLESRLDELQGRFEREHDALVRAQARLTTIEEAPVANTAPPATSGRSLGSSIAAILALTAAAFGIRAWRRRRALESQLAPVKSRQQDLPPMQAAPEAAVVASSTPVPVEPRAVQAEPLDVPHEAHDAPSAAPHGKAAERRWVAEASAGRRNGVASGSNEAPGPIDIVDVEALEASYLLQGDGAGFEQTDTFADTAILPQTQADTEASPICVDDLDAETTPVETARILGIPESTTRALSAPSNAAPATKAGAEETKLDYNLLDLDVVHHVQMPSALHESVGFKERRTSLVDALKSAVEREPHRRDLRMKLVETYYAAAAANRQGFLDAVQKIARERASMTAGEWEKIVRMGRQIASDDDLFAPDATQPDLKNLANCA